MTVIRLIDATKTYLHAVIDNFSRRILAWKLAARLEPQTTCLVLSEAARHLPPMAEPTTVMADSGVENVNSEVDKLLNLGHLRRVLAQIEVVFSNSILEALWRSMKHNWLYLHRLDSFSALDKLIGFYVAEHNTAVPHAAFEEQTPDEMYFGRGEAVPEQLAAARHQARLARIEANRKLNCNDCRAVSAPQAPTKLLAQDEQKAA